MKMCVDGNDAIKQLRQKPADDFLTYRFSRMKGDILIIAPPLIITATEVDEIIQIVRDVLTEAAGR